MEKLSLDAFKHAQIKDIGKIWGGQTGNCWTKKTCSGCTTTPCGDKDDEITMVEDSNGAGAGYQAGN